MCDVGRDFEVVLAVSRRTLVGAKVGLHLAPLRLDHVIARRVGQSGADLRLDDDIQVDVVHSTTLKLVFFSTSVINVFIFFRVPPTDKGLMGPYKHT